MSGQLIEFSRLQNGEVVERVLIDPTEVHLRRYPAEVNRGIDDVIELRRGIRGYRALVIGELITEDREKVPAIFVAEDHSDKFGKDSKLVKAFAGEDINKATLDSPLERLVHLRQGNGSRFRLVPAPQAA